MTKTSRLPSIYSIEPLHQNLGGLRQGCKQGISLLKLKIPAAQGWGKVF